MNELYDALYKHKELLKGKIARIEEDDQLSPENKKDIIGFLRGLEAEGLTPVRRLKYAMNMATIGLNAKKDFKSMERSDVESLLLDLGKKPYSRLVLRDFRIALKRFFKWLRNSDEYPDEVRWIHPKEIKTMLSPDALLSEDEVKRMAEAAFNTRDRALLGILYDSGCRIGEILTLTLGKVKDEGEVITIEVDGKTGKRRVPLVERWVLESLRSWLMQHPLKNNPNAPLFVLLEGKRKNKLYTYPAAVRRIEDIALRAGITKKVHPHLFRHSRSSELAEEMPEALLNKHQGWVQGSRMPQVYLHMRDESVEKKMLEYARKKEGNFKTDEEALLESAFLLLDDPEVLSLAVKKARKNPVKSGKIRDLITPLIKRGIFTLGIDAPSVIKRSKKKNPATQGGQL